MRSWLWSKIEQRLPRIIDSTQVNHAVVGQDKPWYFSERRFLVFGFLSQGGSNEDKRTPSLAKEGYIYPKVSLFLLLHFRFKSQRLTFADLPYLVP